MPIQTISRLSLLLMTVAIPALAAKPATSPSATQHAGTLVVDGETQANAAANAILQRHLPELRFNANGFSDVIDFMRDVTAPIQVEWPVLEAAGISRDAPVSARLRDVKFGTALNVVLQSVSVNVEVVYVVEAGVIHITTADRATQRMVVQTYDVSALAKTPVEVGVVRQLILNNIDASSWKENGGDIGAISTFKEKLVVTHNSLTQQKVSALLQSLGDHTAAAAGDPNSAQPHPSTKPAKTQH